MRVANLDMTDPTQQCPDGFQLRTRSEPPLRTCGRPEERGCVSTTFPVHGIEYYYVCGRIVGYQVGATVAFVGYSNQEQNINGHYLDGISLTHGQSLRQHIWSFANALAEGIQTAEFICPCTNNVQGGEVPPFVGTDYFCDTAIRDSSYTSGLFYPSDPLWDGQGCGDTSTCCEFNNPPWFCKELPQPTADDIELRICNVDQPDDSPFEIVDIFVF